MSCVFKYLFWILIALITLSCNSPERKLKKFIKRVNAREVNASSKYIWPEDYDKLYIFKKRFIDPNPLASFELLEADEIENEGSSFVRAKIKCLNCPPEMNAYFESLGIKKGDIIEDDFEVKKTGEEEYLSLNWGWKSNELPPRLNLSTINTEKLNLRSGPGTKHEVIGTKTINEDIIVDADYENESWRRGIIFDENNQAKEVYFSNKLSNVKNISFFSLSYFGSISIIVLCILGIVVWGLVYPLVLASSFKLAEGGPYMALIMFALLVGSLFFTYQILENLLFELFLINLPY
ncbi:MAG TPA: hypothetical protein DCR46_06705 [Cytophagales bacterium]|nr:hypothetical protein [Cytophagales bacterium]